MRTLRARCAIPACPSALYELPVGHGKKYLDSSSRAADTLLGGWQLGGVVKARTGVP